MAKIDNPFFSSLLKDDSQRQWKMIVVKFCSHAGPFGGMKYSGGARELGIEGLDQFRETKHVHLDFNMEDKSYWYPYGR